MIFSDKLVHLNYFPGRFGVEYKCALNKFYTPESGLTHLFLGCQQSIVWSCVTGPVKPLTPRLQFYSNFCFDMMSRYKCRLVIYFDSLYNFRLNDGVKVRVGSQN